MNVFSYGSNMSPRRMLARVPGAAVVAAGFVPGRRFVFHKRSVDGSAKADALCTGDEADRVWGVVYDVPRHQKPQLDTCEFLGTGYDEHELQVHLAAGGPLHCRAYIARTEAIDAMLKPYTWYKSLVLHGARAHALPNAYIEILERYEAVIDPDQRRHQEHMRLLREV